MSEPDPPAGWYPDPSSEAGQLRWWDGAGWTDETRARDAAPSRSPRRSTAKHAAPWPRERMIAAGAIAALLLASLGVWIAAVVAGRDGPTDQIAIDDPEQAPSADAPDEQDEPSGDDANGEPSPDEPGDDDQTDGADDAGEGDDGEPAVIDFDGRCEVEVDPADIDDPESLRPWDFPECERAPIALDDTSGRWIVVIASLNGDEVDEAEALERSQRSDNGLLWSSHYPSLNPGLWVLYDGPFRDEDAATEAADRIGGGSYPRLVSDDDDDRYCIAADGCVGGSGD